MPTPRASAAGAVLNGQLYLIGGIGGEGTKTVYAYSPKTNTWATRASLPTAQVGLAAGRVMLNGRGHILALGGNDGLGSQAASPNALYTP